ncbi:MULTISPECIES: ABC transporter ATP-binding protein [Roseivirga]|uniref:ATP-binding protein n=1 Tax=Roseivirga spongicola TaxID=333140 RepID=A0A150XGX3_9BACT|nr:MULTISPECIES: ABC transporter ATP-binding protein [Roseivirga]PWL30693.1 MAG: ABC transporter ATP-binding protein [Roseivirga sp. XM-24bin3]KYG77963.1 ATP-binding protein [Roseivirga spongicola]MBO6661222.1 ABC transporter ATP-binding protein [Roseivirga sp.]MBO6759539.1 ABC transporter ATP-binding protein [Roseivirga sp.]MBO6908794.1 ABC transporter ATP-binding protein [Roseivirga sp.]
MITVKGLRKQYKGVTVVNIPELIVGKGESFGLVGNNGAGKTTFFRMILDLVRPTEGEVLSQGTDVKKTEDWKYYTGSFLDESFLIDYLTPDEYFEFVASLHDYSAGDLQEFLSQFEALFNGEIIGQNKYIRDLSKGNQKKVGIAAALMGRPEVILLDEPFANLDPTTQIRLKNLLRDWKENHQLTMLISSHDLNHVTEVCERIVLLEKGEVKQDIKTSSSTLKDLEDYFAAY